MRTGSPVVVRVVTKQLVPPILLFALYVQFHGDYGPGGGFQAGVILAAGIVLYGMVFGIETAKAVLPPSVLLFSAVGLYGLATGYHFLDYAALDPEDPAHGQHLGLLLIEFGVGVTVAATMLLLFYTFTSRRPPR